MSKKTIAIEDIGNINLYKNNKAKSLRIIIRPGKTPRVTIPYRMSFREAEKFVHSKTAWIKENLEKIRNMNK